jgi:hypothetical protein
MNQWWRIAAKSLGCFEQRAKCRSRSRGDSFTSAFGVGPPTRMVGPIPDCSARPIGEGLGRCRRVDGANGMFGPSANALHQWGTLSIARRSLVA